MSKTIFKKNTDLRYEFKITRHTEPKEIANLWDLDVKGPADDEWVKVCQADMLGTCVAKVSFIFEQDGL